MNLLCSSLLRLAAVFVLLVPSVPGAPPSRTFHNPILFADYSDPDVLRDGNHFYLVASTFAFVPGIPILESPDLVHWTILGHVLPRIMLNPQYDLVGGNRYGAGVWAPALRKHNGLFYVYFPTPDEGIFVSTAHAITGPWSAPVAVIAQPGLEDPCPFWDDDGTAYLIHSKRGAGPLILHRMTPDGLSVLDPGKEIVRDPKNLPTLEGPKLYKRHGFYYIFAPFGGVSTGSQAVLRSRSIDGPYEARTVLAQGTTAVNGPHQGAYLETPSGDWFVHFQSRGAHGRILHLEPVRWQDDWPIIGEAAPGGTTGQPVASGTIPSLASKPSTQRPQTSDNFTAPTLAPQWEWNHNPGDTHWSLTERPGFLRLTPSPASSLLTARNTLTQMMQDETFDLTARLDLSVMKDNTRVGLAMFEKSFSGLQIDQTAGIRTLSYFHLDQSKPGPALTDPILQLRVHIDADTATYFYSLNDGRTFLPLGPPNPITFSWWKGSRPALFAYNTQTSGRPTADPGHLDIDWVHYTPKAHP